MNQTALVIAIAYGAVCAVAVVALLLVWHSTHPPRPRRDDTADTERMAHGEKTWFVVASVALGILLLSTLAFIPYGDNGAAAGQQVVSVEGRQFAWSIDPGTVRAGEPVRFVVTSGDVTHGFGVYDADNVLQFQVQAIPDHPTNVVHTFDTPGTYQVVCLEFCGVGHHRMLSTFEVTG